MGQKLEPLPHKGLGGGHLGLPTPRPTTPRGYGSLGELGKSLGGLKRKGRRKGVSGELELKRDQMSQKGEKVGTFIEGKQAWLEDVVLAPFRRLPIR